MVIKEFDEYVYRRPPNVYSLYRWLADFLTANFQQRASFVAGLALGLRIG
jgi:FUN14 domain-containing protein 1